MAVDKRKFRNHKGVKFYYWINEGAYMREYDGPEESELPTDGKTLVHMEKILDVERKRTGQAER